MIELRESTYKDSKQWNDFVLNSESPHNALAYEWKGVLEKTYGHTCHYLGAYEGEVIRGVLPLVFVASPLFGKSLISVPYLNGGGCIGDSDEIHAALTARANEIAHSYKTSYIEYRHRDELSSNKKREFIERSHKVAMVLPLAVDEETIFSTFSSKLRSQIRRPTKEGIVASSSGSSNSAVKVVDDFYAVFSRNMRDLGTPVYPIQLFQESVRAFGERARVVIARLDSKPVAAGITIGFGESTEIIWASSLREYNKLSPNMLLYWEAIKQARKDGYSRFDFGRSSPESGTYRFKAQWGANPEPLHWYYDTVDNVSIPDVNPNSAKFRLLVSLWKRLPLPIANTIGPFLTKGIP